MPETSSFDGLSRVDHPDYPDYALWEALLNAVVHRDYDYSGSTIINIYDNRIELVSLGGLVKGITMEDVFGGVSQSRNTVIAAIFYRTQLIEAYGAGIQRIMESYEGCLQKPMFRPAPASFVVTLPKMDHSEAAFENGDISREELALKAFQEKGELARKDIEQIIGQSKFPAIQLLNKLLAEGKIVKTGSAKAVRYRLASK